MSLARTGVLAASLLLAGCASVVSATPEEVRIDTAWLGEVAPGTRVWLSWLRANEQCAAYGKRPKIADLQGGIAVYRCVAETE